MILHATSTSPSEPPQDWVDQLETNSHGVRLLTLRTAFELAAKGGCAGWYIAPYAVKWTVGRMARNGRRYHVLSDGEPMRFDSVAEALQFLAGILRLAAAPQVALDFPGASSTARATSVPGFNPRSTTCGDFSAEIAPLGA